jgi:Family of unknown function (DUF5762)
MAEIFRCPLFWTENPKVLIHDITDFFPFSQNAKLCSTIALNSLTRFGIYLGLILALITHKTVYLGIPVLTAILAIALFYGMKQQGTLRTGFGPDLLERPLFYEGFADIEGTAAANKMTEDIIGVKSRANPTDPNPFMNILINEISDYPPRAPAKYASSGEVKDRLEKQFEVQVYGDPGDIWNRNQGQRQFYTNPSTSVPNDRDSFQNWLYRIPGKTCKEGNMAVCKTGSDGSALPMFNQS